MRTSMVPGMLNMIAYNLNRDVENVRLFEAGQVFEAAGASALEVKQICLGATGSAVLAGVHQPARPLTFFDLKGDVESLLNLFDHSSLHFDTNTSDYYHPGRSARTVMDGATMAQFGQIHPEIAAARKLRHDVFVAELYLDRLYKHGLRAVRYQPLPRYPAVERDFSFVFDDGVLFEKIRQALEGLRLSELRSFTPVEIFRGGNITGRQIFHSAAREISIPRANSSRRRSRAVVGPDHQNTGSLGRNFAELRMLAAMFALAAALLFASTYPAQSAASVPPTFYKDVVPILQDHCQSCHRPGQLAPMPLVTYAETKPYAMAIRHSVEMKMMPPWFADPTVGNFSNDSSLLPQQIATLLAWADADAPAGDPRDAPPTKHWAEGWNIPRPDLVLKTAAADRDSRSR